MTETSQPQVMMSEIMRDAPRNWGRWGDSDQVGALNLLTPEVIAGVAAEIHEGRTFTLGASLGGPDGEPVWPAAPSPSASATVTAPPTRAGRPSRSRAGWSTPTT